jgi:uncharacterized protein (DUF2164 family)
VSEQPSGLKLPREQKLVLVRELVGYLEDNLDCESGELGAELLLDFVSQLIGPYHYNLALEHARLAVSRGFDGIEESLVALERQPNVRR